MLCGFWPSWRVKSCCWSPRIGAPEASVTCTSRVICLAGAIGCALAETLLLAENGCCGGLLCPDRVATGSPRKNSTDQKDRTMAIHLAPVWLNDSVVTSRRSQPMLALNPKSSGIAHNESGKISDSIEMQGMTDSSFISDNLLLPRRPPSCAHLAAIVGSSLRPGCIDSVDLNS